MKKYLNPKNHARKIVHVGRKSRLVVDKKLSVGNNYIYSVDSPRQKNISKRTVLVEGWIISKDDKSFKLRVKNNQKTHPVKMNLKRLDVSKAYPDLDNQKTLQSGFSAEFEFEDGKLVVELDRGKGYKKLYSTEVIFSVEKLPKALYNKELSNNYPEHLNLIENRKKYYYEDAAPGNFTPDKKDSRLVAMYLPQFHPFKENDKAWGKGFTEWTNVTSAQPRFIGHQQPILPKDLGYYDLRLESNIEAQINLAKKYGVHGFCFYYYWFSGKKLMETPLNSFLKHKEWDFNFTICWANENWTKRWDGRDNDVIIAQQYLENDPLEFIKDVEDILLDSRYINEDGKPVLMVYRASELKEPKKYVKVWRDYFRKKHNKELQLVSFLSFDDKDPREYGFDAGLDFAPLSAFFKNDLFDNNQFPYLSTSDKLLDPNFSGVVADYRSIALNEKLDDAFDYPVYPCVTPSWDNDARKKGNGFVYQNSSPDIYAQWLRRVVQKQSAKKDSPLVFVNAWNEWAEGAILEPSMHNGHAVLNRTAEVLAATSKNKANQNEFPAYGIKRQKSKKLAVIVHLYYTDMWDEIAERLARISQPFDLFITLNERDSIFVPTVSDKKVVINTYVVPNRGRDVLPFLFMAKIANAAGYEQVLKIHSKKSKHRQDGSSWFTELMDSLLPSEKGIATALDILNKEDTGIIGPKNHLVSLQRHMGSNKPILENLLSRIYDVKTAHKVIRNSDRYPYIGGTMFWARMDAITPILDLHLLPDDFQSEHGQIDGTAAHAIERLFGSVVKLNKKKMYVLSADGADLVLDQSYTDKYTYAP